MSIIKNVYEQNIANVLEECVFIVNVDTHKLVYINDALQKFVKNVNIQDLTFTQFIDEIGMPCPLLQDISYELDTIVKKYYYKEVEDLHFIMKYKFTKYDGEMLLVQTFYDITEEFYDIRVLEDEIHTNKAIIKCANTLLEDTGTFTNVKSLLKIICDYYKGCRANLFLFNNEDNTIFCAYEYYSEGALSIFDKVQGAVIDADLWRDIIKDNNYYSENVDVCFRHDPTLIGYFELFKVNSIMVTAIQKENENVGFIVVDNPCHKANDFNLLDTASIFVANNIERQLFEDELENSVIDIAKKIDISGLILACADILFKNKDIPLAIKQILKLIADFFKADRCTLLEYFDEENHDDSHSHKDEYIHIKMTYEYAKDGVASLIDNYKGVTLHQDTQMYNRLKEYNCVYTKLEDLSITKNSLEYEILIKNNVKSVMIVPLRNGSTTTGVVMLQNPTIKLEETNVLYTISGFLISELHKRDIVKELEHMSFSDKLTGLYNRNYYLRTIENLKLSPPDKLGVIFADINGLKRVNDNLGHEYGDAFIKWCADFLHEYNNDYLVFRIGGDEFIAIVCNMEAEEFFDHVKLMRDKLYEYNLVNMSMGGTFVEGDVDISKQIIETDKIMYQEKQKYYILKKLMNVNVEAELDTLKNLLSELL